MVFDDGVVSGHKGRGAPVSSPTPEGQPVLGYLAKLAPLAVRGEGETGKVFVEEMRPVMAHSLKKSGGRVIRLRIQFYPTNVTLVFERERVSVHELERFGTILLGVGDL